MGGAFMVLGRKPRGFGEDASNPGHPRFPVGETLFWGQGLRPSGQTGILRPEIFRPARPELEQSGCDHALLLACPRFDELS